MNPLMVKKSDIINIRESLQLPLFDLLQYMNKLGWHFSLNMPNKERKHSGSIYFTKKDPWHSRTTLACSCKYGYSFDDINQTNIQATAQRSAELCLTVYDVFTEDIPGTPNIYGEIKSEIIVNGDDYRHMTYSEFKSKHQDKDFTAYTAFNPEDRRFSFYRSFIYIVGNERSDILKLIEKLKAKLNGTSAFEC
jgi:hypothetical protein